MSLCKCGKRSRKGQRYCRACHATYMRRWRNQYPLTKAIITSMKEQLKMLHMEQ